jgi:hypothetical protein
LARLPNFLSFAAAASVSAIIAVDPMDGPRTPHLPLSFTLTSHETSLPVLMQIKDIGN